MEFCLCGVASSSDSTNKGALGVGLEESGGGVGLGSAAAVDLGVKKLEMDCCFFAWDEGGCDGLLLEGAIVQLLMGKWS